MKKVLIFLCTLFVLQALFCNLPEDPSRNPSNSSAVFTTVNGYDPADLNAVIAGDPVSVGYLLRLPDFIDSVLIKILSQQQKIEAEYIVRKPWEKEENFVSLIFPFAGTKTCLLTSFKNNGTTSDTKLIFVVTYRQGNRPPVWRPDTVELTSQKVCQKPED